MALALQEAEQALNNGEFPVGCIISDGKTVIASGRRTATVKARPNEIDHAEINALRTLDNLSSSTSSAAGDLTLYCTLEPCLMCFGAILLSGIHTIVYAYEDVMGGGTICDLSQLPPLYKNKDISLVKGIMRSRSLELFARFFMKPDNTYWKDSLLSRYTLAEQKKSLEKSARRYALHIG